MWTDETLRPVGGLDSYTAPDGTFYPAAFPKADIPGLVKVVETNPPSDPALVVEGFHIDEALTQVWITRAETADEARMRINPPILAQLDAIDGKSVRPLRAVLAAQSLGLGPDPADLGALAALTGRAAALRAQLVT